MTRTPDPTDDVRWAVIDRWAELAGAATEKAADGREVWALGPEQQWPGEVPIRLLARLLPEEDILGALAEVARCQGWRGDWRDIGKFYYACYAIVRERDIVAAALGQA